MRVMHSLHVGLRQQTILKYEYMNCLRISFLALSLGLYC